MNTEENKLKFEGMVGFKKDKYDILLTINDTNLVFQKMGMISKQYRVIKEIVGKDIKILKDIPMVEYNDGELTIHTTTEIVKIYCEKDEDATKITNAIKTLLGLGFKQTLERTGELIEEGFNEVVDAAKGFVKEVSESDAVKEGTKAIKDAFNGMVDSLNNKK